MTKEGSSKIHELLLLFKLDAGKHGILHTADDFVEWICRQRYRYQQMCLEYKWKESDVGFVSFIRTRQHAEHQKEYLESHKEGKT